MIVPYAIHDVFGQQIGIALIDSASSEPIPLRIDTFSTLNEAQHFLDWLGGAGLRAAPGDRWAEMVDIWRIFKGRTQ
jgi:hypothetical protein